MLKRYSKSEVKAQGYSKTKMHFCGGGLHFDGVASRLLRLGFKISENGGLH